MPRDRTVRDANQRHHLDQRRQTIQGRRRDPRSLKAESRLTHCKRECHHFRPCQLNPQAATHHTLAFCQPHSPRSRCLNFPVRNLVSFSRRTSKTTTKILSIGKFPTMFPFLSHTTQAPTRVAQAVQYASSTRAA